MSYTDKELQLATQIAYMKISGDDIQSYYFPVHAEFMPVLPIRVDFLEKMC